MKSWRDIVKDRLEELGLTQENLAERLGMTQGGLGHWLNGKRQPPFEKVGEIADFLGIERAILGAALLNSSNEGVLTPTFHEPQKLNREIQQIVNALQKADDDGRLSKELAATILKVISLAAPLAQPTEDQDADLSHSELEALYNQQAIVDNRENFRHQREQQEQRNQAQKDDLTSNKNKRKHN